MYKLQIKKVRSMWSYTLHNPQGGSFGSNAVTTRKGIIYRAIQHLPTGTRYELETNGKNEGVYTK
jgi:hypothetical protein